MVMAPRFWRVSSRTAAWVAAGVLQEHIEELRRQTATGLAVDLAATGILRGMRRRSKDAQRNNERNGTPNRHVHE